VNNEEQIKSKPEMDDKEIQDKDGLKNDSRSDSRPIKVSDDSNSNEILVFTSFNNVYKVQKREIIDKFQALQKIVLFNTSQINPVGSRTTKGVQVMKPKDGSFMIKVKRLEHTKFTEPEYYRKSETLNVVGYYLKQGDEV
jgi:hypothetical protein